MNDIIDIVKSRNEIVMLEDGFYRYTPSNLGAIGAMELRLIADELDKMNEEWASEIENAFAYHRA